jgi:hypothetical protein
MNSSLQPKPKKVQLSISRTILKKASTGQDLAATTFAAGARFA